MNTNPSSIQLKSRTLWIVVLLLLVAGLAACGGDDAPEATEAPAEATALPTDAPAEPAVAPTDVPPTEVPPTAEPIAVAPTAAPEEAAAPGECNSNPYYPIVDGRAMTYATNADDISAGEYTSIFSDVTDSSFTLTTDLGDGDVIATNWQCSSEGLLSPEFSQMPGGMEGLEIEFVEATGVSVPTEEMFQVGQSWPTHYVANATMAIDDENSMTMTQTIVMTNTVTGIEPVSVPAGDYSEAVVVETKAAITVAMSGGGAAPSLPPIEMNYISWYVEDVGLVRQEIVDFFSAVGGGSYITELTAIE